MSFTTEELVSLKTSFGELLNCGACGLPSLIQTTGGEPLHVACAPMNGGSSEVEARSLLRKAFPGLEELDDSGASLLAQVEMFDQVQLIRTWNASHPARRSA